MPEEEGQAELTDGEEKMDGPVEDPDYPLGEKSPITHGVKIRGKVKRGEGTRDQDELLLEARGEDADEAAADFEAALTHAEEHGWDDRLRQLQPDEETSEEETDGE